MTLGLKLGLYIGLLHLAIFILLIWQRVLPGGWLIVGEAVLAITLFIGLRLVYLALRPVRATLMLRDILQSREFGSRYAPVGHAEVDSILDTYNEMLAGLHRDWLRLGEQRGFLDRFLQDTLVGVMIFDFEGRISLVNRRARDLLGIGIDDDPTGRELGALDSPLARWLVRLPSKESRMMTDAAGRRLLCRRAEFQDRGFSRAYVLIEELTAELNRHERVSYERFVRVVAHEVTNSVAATNSLLHSCIQYAGQIPRDEDRADYVDALSVLITRNRNLQEFTDRFSELVKLPEPNRQDVDVGELLHEMQTMFRAEVERCGCSLVVRAGSDLPRVSLDRNQMDRVLINIVKNAIEAVKRDGCIELIAASDGACVEVTVVDDGVGLDRAAGENLFVPFYTTKGHGQGLGLSLVKEILVRHDFSFSLETSGGRTRFRLRMPAVERATSSGTPSSGARSTLR